MKKLIIACIVIVFFIGNVWAYSSTQLEEKKASYKVLIEKKLGHRLGTVSTIQSQVLMKRIDKAIRKYESSKKISDFKRLKNIAILLALKEVIEWKKVP